MEYYFVELEGTQRLATILDPNKKPRTLCFKNRAQANKYRVYACKHKSVYGHWPSVDLSSPIFKVKEVPLEIRENYNDLLENLVVRKQDDHFLEWASVVNDLSFFYCHYFDNEELKSVRMQGQEYDGFADEVVYRANLDYSLKNI
jgi:hypothetical protein